jgi:protein SCO1/2
MKGFAKHWFTVALVVLVAVVALWIWQPWPAGGKLEMLGEAPDFTLESAEGRQVSLSDSVGKVRLVYFFFSHCPDICIPTTAMLSKLQEELKERGLFGDRVVLHSISFDPQRDTRERLELFANGYQADFSGWHFLRGNDEPSVIDLAKQYNISVINLNNGNYMHQNYFVLIDGNGQKRKYYDANDMETVLSGVLVKEMADDMERLAKEG